MTATGMTVVPLSFIGILALSSIVGGWKTDPDWDYIAFSQGWPQTRCMSEGSGHSRHHHQNHDCVIPDYVNSWTVHGVWPSRSDGGDVENCQISHPFDEDELKPLLPELKVMWPNLFQDSDPYSFWKHEWDKHGRCATIVKQMGDEPSYFKTGLLLANKYNLTRIFSNASIKPNDDKPFKLSDLTDALKKQIQTKVTVSCFWNKSEHKAYIAELHVCLSKDFQPMDCPEEYNRKNLGYFEPCRGGEDLYYPVIKHSGTPWFSFMDRFLGKGEVL